MISGRIKLTLAGLAVGAAACGYFLYGAFAAQALPDSDLAQAPLNTQVQIPPAFIMAVDDSGSMTFQVLFQGLDGAACWSNSERSFFDGGQLRRSGNDCAYYYLFPHRGYSISRSGVAIPPIDQLGFARSPEFNPSYFDPSPDVEYGPWLKSNGSPLTIDGYTDEEGNAVVTSTRADPRLNQTGEEYVFDFTADRRIYSDRSQFRIRTGMILPRGMEYYRIGQCGDLGASDGNNRWVHLDEDRTVGTLANGSLASCMVGLRYFPATFYLSVDKDAPAGYKSNVVSPDANNRVFNGRSLARNACGAGCDMYRYEIRPENYTTPEAYDAAIQKFANWFSYYGNRNRAMIAGMTRSMATVQNMRIGYFELKNRPSLVTMRNMQTSGQRAALFEDMMSLGASGGTPNLRAVDHIGKQFQRTDDDAPIQYACQKNAGMLFTDGFSNDGTPGAPAITGLGAPFDETPSGSLAAIATRYYLNADRQTIGNEDGGVSSLRTGTGFASGQVPIPRAACAAANPDPRLDCQSNLHMNFYGITLGARGRYFDPDADPPQDPWANPPVWPSHSNDDPSTIDDILHATINTRGEFINARTPADITRAMRRILAAVSSGESPSGSIALTGSRIGSGSLTVTPAYAIDNEGTDWWSSLTAHSVTVNSDTREADFSFAWDASQRIQAHAGRNVFFANGPSVSPFTAANVDLEDLCRKPDGLYENMLLCDGSPGIGDLGVTRTQAVEYLLGNQSLEVQNGGFLRDRTRVLGDIVNSTPVISAPTDDYGYGRLPEPYGGAGGGSYAEYLESKRESRRYMVYVGANDGMLHAFDGGLTSAMVEDGLSPDSNGGRERFAYIPGTAVGHMGNLLIPYDPANQHNQTFQHRYYVDGPVVVSDAYFDSAWSTVLVGTAGAGGRSVFALDVGDASRATGSFSASDRLWEISDVDEALDEEVRENIGHVLGRPVIVPVKTSDGSVSWNAIFGNGYNSASGKAVLFVVELESPSGEPTVRMIEAEEAGAGVPSGSNGLGNIVVLDRFRGDDLDLVGQDGFADTVYAGDQKGAVWKFDLRDSSIETVTTPLFVTMSNGANRQPITGGITAAAGPGGGVMLYFGTGSFSFYGDPEDMTVQSLYAVNDRGFGQPSATMTRGSLGHSFTVVSSGGMRTLDGTVDVPVVNGWFIDLPPGERVVGNPSIAAGTVFIPTYIPDQDSSGCSAGGSNWMFGLNARTGQPALASVRSNPGGALLYPPLDESSPAPAAVELTDADGGSIGAPVKDIAVMVVPREGALVPGTSPPAAPPPVPEGHSCWMLINPPGADPMYLPYPCGRQSWRQIQ